MVTTRRERVGAKIRTRRRELGLSLRKLAEYTDLSVSFLSMVERGRSSAALASLYKVADALGVDVSYFLSTEGGAEATDPPPYVVRASETASTTITSAQRNYRVLSGRTPGLKLEPLLVTIEPGGEPEEPYNHEGEEFAFVLSGELTYVVEGEDYRLGPGDSIHIKSTVAHRIYNSGEGPAQAVWVLTPRFVRVPE